jgi:ABC-type Na+ efflux pump permease subunit
VGEFTASIPGLGDLAQPLLEKPAEAQIYYLLFQYLLAPLFVIVPLMVAAVLAADTFAGEKERKTLEALLHLPVRESELFVAKLLTTLLPAIAISWGSFVAYAIVANTISWPVVGQLIVPNGSWLLLIFWVGPGVIAFGLGLIVRISARARSSQEANQLGGAIILPLIFMVMGQATTLLLLPAAAMFGFGVVVWVASIALFRSAARRFTRDRLATNV